MQFERMIFFFKPGSPNWKSVKEKNEKFVKFKMGHGCIPNLKEKLDCSSSGSSGSPGHGSGHNCGCDPEDVAFKNIVGYGKATCTKPGKKSGKKSVWTLTCGKIFFIIKCDITVFF